jgi:L-fucose isomerase-like protein
MLHRQETPSAEVVEETVSVCVCARARMRVHEIWYCVIETRLNSLSCHVSSGKGQIRCTAD